MDSLTIARLMFLVLPMLIEAFSTDHHLMQQYLEADRQKAIFDEFGQKFLQPNDFVLAEVMPVKQPSDEELSSMINSKLFEGDIEGIDFGFITLRDQPEDAFAYIFKEPYHSALNLATYPDKLWPNGRIPYELENGLTPADRAAIAQAFDEYRKKTCIRFVPKQESDKDFIHIKQNVAFGCSSYVGRAGGNQTVSLEIGKCFKKGIIEHELMHTIGFFHEHSRTDRDKYVLIDTDSIRPEMLRNFDKYPKKVIDSLGMPYDYASVMHYHKLAFSRNGHSTILPRVKNVEIGQRKRLSVIDALKINKLYGCSGTVEEQESSTTTSTPATTTATSTTTTTTITTTATKITTTTATPITERVTTGGYGRKTNPPYRPVTNGQTIRPLITRRPSSTTAAPISQTTHQTGCKDLNAHCPMWQTLGHCQHSPKYMAHYCRQSCGLCPIKGGQSTSEQLREVGARCLDRNFFCGYWAKIGECSSGSKFMRTFCRRSCGECDQSRASTTALMELNFRRLLVLR